MEVIVARQPILDRNKKIVAYELLFRSGVENYFNFSNGDEATTSLIINSFLVIGINTLTDGKRAFINFTEKLLVQELASLLPKDMIGVEILEDIEPSREIIDSCKKLKMAGYLIVLDDFVYHKKLNELISLADIIKIDFLSSSRETCRSIIRNPKYRNIKFLAEKVETKEDFEIAYQAGYSYFQGYFFDKPYLIAGSDIPSFKINHLLLLEEVNRPAQELNFAKIEDIIKRDMSLSYKILKYVNSVGIGRLATIKSIKQALVLLGHLEVRKLITLFAVHQLAQDKPDILIITSVVRARFCELIAPLVGLENESFELFMVGMFSMIDAFMDQPRERVLTELSLSQNIKKALLLGAGMYAAVLDLALYYEKGLWDDFSISCEQLGVAEKDVSKIYLQAVEWGNSLLLP